MRCELCDERQPDCLCDRYGIWTRLARRPVWQQWSVILVGYMALIWLVTFAVSAQAQSFTADPAGGISPVKVTLVWDIPGAASCEASGSWSGTKAATGQLITNINAPATYTLTCVKPGTGGTSSISWTPPKTNTDGTPLTDGKGYTLVHGLTDTTMDKAIDLPGIATSSYTVNDLPAGMHWFGIQAYNSFGTKSTRVVVSKLIVVTPGAQNFAATVRVDVTQQPNPPTEVRIVFAPGEEPPSNSTPQLLANLTPICSDLGSIGKQSCQVPPTHFDFPTDASIVKSDGTWLMFGSLAATTNVLVCSAAQLPGAIADPYRSLCDTDTYLPKSQVPLSVR